ncbi:MAG: glycoside hydrolase domain-containing protein [Pirellulales bacterium]
MSTFSKFGAWHLLFLSVTVAAFAEEVRLPRTVCWEPYISDGTTTVLCHFDGRQELAIETLFDDVLDDNLDENLAGTDLTLTVDAQSKAGSAARTAASDVRGESRTVPLVGGCEEVADKGRFGGGLRLHGKDGRLGAAGQPGLEGWTLEAWFKPARLPEQHATLVEMTFDKPLRVTLRGDGSLAVEWLGRPAEEVPGVRIAAGQWFHLALVWPRTEMQLVIDGRIVLSSGEQPPAAFERLVSQSAAIGNDGRGTSGFDGWLDELRLSSQARKFYEFDLDWVDAEGTRPATPGQPFFRDQESLLFRAAFDDTVAPTDNPRAASLATGIPVDAAALMENRKGWAFEFGAGVAKQSLLLKPGENGVRYESVPVPADQGSIAFWIRPRDWDNARPWSRFANFAQEFAPVFALEQDGKKIFGFTWIKTPNGESYVNEVDFNPGRWQHLMLTWLEGRISRVYLNGKPWSHQGTVEWHYDRKPWDPLKPVSLVLPTVKHAIFIDDFRVYGRPLAPSEAANLAALPDRRVEPRPLKDFDFIKDVNGVFGTAKVTLWPLMKDHSRVQSATLAFAPAGSEDLLGSARAEVEPDKPINLEVRTAPFGFGDYTLKITSFDQADEPLGNFVIPHTRVRPPWWESKAGISDKVMPDWEPVTIERGGGSRTGDDAAAAVARIALRTIHLSAAGLPEKIISQGEDILTGPVQMVATVAGQELPFSPVSESFRAETKGEVRADFSGTARAGGVTASTKGFLEFDGFMWFEVTLTGEPLSRLQLRIPYAGDAATLLHAWGGNAGFRDPMNVRIMELPHSTGAVFSSLDKKLIRTADGLRGSFMPYAFLTGDRRGMAWFAENDRGWTQSTETPALEIERLANGDVALTLNVITERVDLTTPRTFAFGLHPTPVKRLDPTWRGWNWWTVSPDSFCGFGMKGKIPAATQFNRFPESWELARERFDGAESWGATGNQPIATRVRGIYYDLQYIGAPPADAAEWWGDWYGSGTLRYTLECVDFTAHYHDEWVRRGLVYGIYMDDAWNSPQRVGPVAYRLADGHVQPGFEWRGARESLKRMRQIFYDHGLTPHMCVHLTHTQYPMWLSFFDEMYDGEDHDLRPAGHPTDFMNYWSPVRLRFHNSQKFGVAPYFHGWVGNNMKAIMGKMPTWTFQQARAYAGALMVHDLGWLSESMPSAVGSETWQTWVRPNMLTQPENVLVPYWDPRPVAPSGPEGLYVTAWKRDGWCGMVLANWTKDRVEAELTLDLAAMGFAGVKPEAVTIRDVDASLISYFDDDVSRLEKPKPVLDDPLAEIPEDLENFSLDAPPTLAERKAADPDGRFEWKDGVLRASVRRHDFRLFEFKMK